MSTIAEITGVGGHTVAMQDSFRSEQTGVDSQSHELGDLAPTGVRPTFADAFETAGVDLDWVACGRGLRAGA